jgi:hypothetical protein
LLRRSRRARGTSRLSKSKAIPFSLVISIHEQERLRAAGTHYADGIGLIHDLVDIYSGNQDVVVLVDGSDDRTIERLMGPPYALARLAQRVALPPTIPADQWRAPLRARFERAALTISDEHLARILDFGEGRPYDTMAGCLYVGLMARRLGRETIDAFVLAKGSEEARARLDEDG